ncbi:MAG TPA: M20/M25/M40 family metallo-hydrolase [Verrucomicrobiae bacterium]|nr:M20/M25/M40 family metallo-hydrolase [Verrucomicrobiae bacterium]
MNTPEQLLDTIKDLLAIESTADNPAGLRGAYAYMREMLRASGSDIVIEEFESNGKPSLLAYSGESRPKKFHVILNGHLDVIPGKPEQFRPFVKEGKLYGRGTYDMKAAVVVLTQVFCEYVNKVPYALGLQLVTDEESNGKHGTLHQIQHDVRADFVICGDCGRVPARYEIANGTKGVVIAEIGFKGTSAHGAYPWRGDNAIMQAIEFGHALHTAYPTPEYETFLTTANITRMSTSNTALSGIPDNAVVTINIRFTDDDPNFQSNKALTEFIHSLNSKAEVVTLYDFCKPSYADPANPLLKDLRAAAEETEKHSFELVMRHGTGDGRFYANVGDQACEFGIAGEHQHGDDECITLEAFENYLHTMRLFLDRTARQG